MIKYNTIFNIGYDGIFMVGGLMEVLPRRSLRGVTPFASELPADQMQRELGVKEIVRLCANESPMGPSPKALAAFRDSAAMTAGSALLVSGKAKTFAEGVRMAEASIDRGSARKSLEKLVKASHG